MIAEFDHELKKAMPMEELKVLDICREIELLNEELYRYLATLFPEDGELVALWRKTANEEANHAQQFELAIKMKKDLLESISIDAGKAATEEKFVRSVIEFTKSNLPNAVEALQISIKLEERLAGLHLACIADFSDNSYKDLFRAMMANDNRHIETLNEARAKYPKVVQ